MEDERQTRVQRLLDEQEIQRALVRYTRGVDRGDLDLIKSAFHADSTVRMERNRDAYSGWQFAQATIDNLTMYDAWSHSISNCFVEFIENEAHVETYVLAVHWNRQPEQRLDWLGARYLDWFALRDGEWKIADRLVVHDWSKTETINPCFDERFENGARGHADPVFTRTQRLRAAGGASA